MLRTHNSNWCTALGRFEKQHPELPFLSRPEPFMSWLARAFLANSSYIAVSGIWTSNLYQSTTLTTVLWQLGSCYAVLVEIPQKQYLRICSILQMVWLGLTTVWHHDHILHINTLVCLLGVFCDGLIRCPWHGACFSVQNGDIEDFPGLDSIPKFDVCCCYACCLLTLSTFHLISVVLYGLVLL